MSRNENGRPEGLPFRHSPICDPYRYGIGMTVMLRFTYVIVSPPEER